MPRPKSGFWRSRRNYSKTCQDLKKTLIFYMIYIDSNSIAVPSVYRGTLVQVMQAKLEGFYLLPQDARRQQKFSDGNELNFKSLIRNDLFMLFRQHCAYCGSATSADPYIGHIDRFRPKLGARGFLKEFEEEHYWWLRYDWGNLYYSCRSCNRFKATWFPVNGRRGTVGMPLEEIVDAEGPLLLDPCRDEPKQHLAYEEDGTISFLSERGKVTIEILKLNRKDLVQERRLLAARLLNEKVQLSAMSLKGAFHDGLRVALFDWTKYFDKDNTAPYLGMIQHLLLKWYASDEQLRLMVTGETSADSQVEVKKNLDVGFAPISETLKHQINMSFVEKDFKHAYLDRIELQNFKCFERLKVTFPQITPIENDENHLEPWLLFLGENGVGKSTLLKAVTIALCGQDYIDRLGITGEELLKNGKRRGFIKLWLVDEKEEPIVVNFSNRGITSNRAAPVANLSAYNSIRLAPAKGKLLPEQTEFEGAKAQNLFDQTVSLIDAHNWLIHCDEVTFDRACFAFKELLQLENDDVIDRSQGHINVIRNGEYMRLEQLSDGYLAIVHLAVDIMDTMTPEQVSFHLAEGVVLIDEIGTHQHPRWRMRIVEGLRKTFRNIQFIVTTHEPLCLRGLKKGEIVVLHMDQDRKLAAVTDLPDPAELRVDQLLTSDFFDLKSTIDPGIEKEFDDYYKLLELPERERSSEQHEEILKLREKLMPKKHIGSTLREEIVYYVTDELLAQKARNDKMKIIRPIKEAAKKRVADIWESMDRKGEGLP